MIIISRTEYGAVTVSDVVLKKMIVDDILSFSDSIIPCNQKGKPIKTGIFSGMNELLGAVEITGDTARKDEVVVRIYFIAKFGTALNELVNALFKKVENDFAVLSLDEPAEIVACIKGVISKKIAKRDIEISNISAPSSH